MLALQGGSWQGRSSTPITLQNTCPHNSKPGSLPSVSSDLKKLFVWASHGHFRLHSTGSNWIFLLICSSAWGCAELTGTRGPDRGPGSLLRVSPWLSPARFLPSPSPASVVSTASSWPPPASQPPLCLLLPLSPLSPPGSLLWASLAPPPKRPLLQSTLRQAAFRESGHPQPPVQAPRPLVQVPTDKPFSHCCPQAPPTGTPTAMEPSELKASSPLI